MNLKTSFVLAILFMLIGTITMLDNFKWSEERKNRESQSSKILQIEDKKVEWLEISNPKQKIKISCDDSSACELDAKFKWRLADSIESRVDQANLNGFYVSLKNLTAIQSFELGEEDNDWKNRYGFVDSKTKLKLKFANQSVTLDYTLGNKAAIGANFYLHSSRKPKTIYLVANYFSRFLNNDQFYWQNKRIFPEVSAANVTEIKWKNVKLGQNMLFKKVNTKWMMESPYKTRANHATIDSLATLLANLKAEKYLKDRKHIKKRKSSITAEIH